MISKASYQEYMGRVGEKLTAAKSKLIIDGQRNEEAVSFHTIPRIIQSCKNLYFSRSGEGYNDPVEAVFAGFSNAPSFGDVSKLETKGIEDISIIGAVKSLVPFLAAERSMTDPVQSFSYQVLKSMAAAGGFSADEQVISPFAPAPIKGNLRFATASLDGEAGASVVVAFNKNLVPGTVIVVVDSAVADNGKLYGQDYAKDGVIHFKVSKEVAGAGVLPVIPTGTINYKTGAVTLVPVDTGFTAHVTTTIDVTADATGADILRMKPDFTTESLIAEPQNVILEGNLESEAYRNKMFQSLMDAGQSIDMGDLSFRQLLDFYVAYINLRVVRETLDAGTLALALYQSGSFVEFDLSGYPGSGFTGYAPTKDDRVQAFFLSLNSKLLGSSGFGMSAMLVGTEGANILANVPGRFVELPEFRTMADGLVGYYNQVPIIRHRLVDSVSATKYTNFYPIYKDPSGKAAPTFMGEYLPMYATRQTLNFNNPTQFAQALFSFMGTKTVLSNLVVAGRIKYLA